MKNITLIFIALFVSANIFAQKNMKIRKTDNSIVSISISEIDSIYYEDFNYGELITDIDGNTYKTVWIGNQLWMAENLKTTHEADGTVIPTVTDDNSDGSIDDEWGALGDNDTDKAYCYYNSSTDSLAKYGVLYTYAAAKDACPTGWHLPTDAEWTELENHITNDGYSGTEGTALKSTTGWDNSGNGTDIYGFSALPGGKRSCYGGTFIYVGYDGTWWSSTESYSSGACSRNLSYSGANVHRHYDNESYGFSVRCVRDN